MLELLQTVAAYVPHSLARVVLTESAPTPPAQFQTRHFAGAVLIADISGFTPLTEALAQKGSEGPEELTRLLNRYFSWMIAFIEAEGGEIVKFGGDALTVVFPAIDEPLSHATRRAQQAADAMQTSMEEFSVIESSVGLVTLKMRLGIGAGPVLIAVVGGVSDRWEYIISGEALSQASQAEQSAKTDNVVLSPEAEAVIFPNPLPARHLPLLDWTTCKNPEAAAAALQCYIPKPVRSWLGKGLHGWLASLRPMSVLFVSVHGIDYQQPTAIEQLHNFTRGAQERIYHYRGSLPRLTVDDKGTVLLILFGAPPYSHEDDPERALRCALDLQTLARQQSIQLAIGVTTGRVFAGPVGGFNRREFTVMGDTVNLAARLMVAIGPGNICCNHQSYRSAYGQMNFERLPSIQVKGKTEPVRIYKPINDYLPPNVLAQRASELLVGRQEETATLITALNTVHSGQSRVMIIEGEAGIGKSKLVSKLIRITDGRGFITLLGMGRSIDQHSPYRAWRDIFTAYCAANKLESIPDKLAHINRVIQSAEPHLVHDIGANDIGANNIGANDIGLLNSVFGLNLPLNAATAALNTDSQQQHRTRLLITLLQAQANHQPLLVVLENAQWLDTQSWELAVQTMQTFASLKLPLLLVIVIRPLESQTTHPELAALTAMPCTTHLRLDSMLPDEILTLTAVKTNLTSNELPEAVAELVRSRAGGNPFFAEEIFYDLRQNGFITFKTMQNKTRCLVNDDFDRAVQTLPATIQNIILTRLDQLPPDKQLLLRVAAIIGQKFAYTTLRDTLAQHLAINEITLQSYLNDLIHLGLITPVTQDSNPIYAFKHIIIREVTYQSVLFDRRRQLHSTVARWYENTYLPETDKLYTGNPASDTHSPIAPYYALLVYHWHQAENDAKERSYAALVGEQAVAQYANAEAMGYINRALDLTPPEHLLDRFNLLLARESVYHRLGHRDQQAQDLKSLTTLAEKMGDTRRQAMVALHQAAYYEAVSNYANMLEAAKLGVQLTQQLPDFYVQSRGYAVWAKALLRQSQYQEAADILNQGLILAQEHHIGAVEAELLYVQAMLHRQQGNYEAAQTICQQALQLCQNNKNPIIEAHCQNLLGQIYHHLDNVVAAQNCFEQAIAIYYTIGDRRGEAIPLLNLGQIYLQQGQYEAARDYFELGLDIAKEIHDQENTARALAQLALFYSRFGSYTIAQSYLGQALGIYKDIGTKFGEASLLSKFGYVYYSQQDYKTTLRYCELALDIQEKIGALEGQSYTQTYYGHALTELADIPAAINAYEKALQLRQATGQTGLAIDALAGLAAAQLAHGDEKQAITLTKQILEQLKRHGLTGIDNPILMYLKIYHVLKATAHNNLAAQRRAYKLLETAHTTLQNYAANLHDDYLRHRFLSKVKTHVDIVDLWEGNKHLTPNHNSPKIKTKEAF